MDNIRQEATRQALQPVYQHSLVSNSFRAFGAPRQAVDFTKVVIAIQDKFLAHVPRADRQRLQFTVMCRQHADTRFTISFSFPTAAAAQQFNAQVRPFDYNKQGIYFTYQLTAPNTQPPRIDEYVIRVMLGPGFIAEPAFRAMVKYTLTESYGATVHEMWQPRCNGYAYQPWLAVKCRGKPDLTRPIHHITWDGLDDWGFMAYYDAATSRKHPELSNPVRTHPTRGHWFAHIPKPAPAPATAPATPATAPQAASTASSATTPAPADNEPAGCTTPVMQPTIIAPTAAPREVQPMLQQVAQPTTAPTEPEPIHDIVPVTEAGPAFTALAVQPPALERERSVATRSSTRSSANMVALGKRSASSDSDSAPDQQLVRPGNKQARPDTPTNPRVLALMPAQIPLSLLDAPSNMDEDTVPSPPSTGTEADSPVSV